MKKYLPILIVIMALFFTACTPRVATKEKTSASNPLVIPPVLNKQQPLMIEEQQNKRYYSHQGSEERII